jgi:hypothetical protein
LRNNQTDPSNPAYTGKILGLDTIYQFDNTVVRGNSTDPGNPLGPVQAPIIPFSWNTNAGAPNGQLPYAYTMDDPAQLQAIVTSPTAGAGAGVLTWAKTNWLITSYAPTAPFIVSQPQDLAVSPGQSATFAVVAGGSANLNYQWYFNTNTPLSGATNSTFTINSVQTTNSGVYSVIVTNVAGSIVSSNAILNASGVFVAPQLSDFTFSNGIFSMTINGDSGPDYIVQASTNLLIWEDIFTNYSPTPPFVWSDDAAFDCPNKNCSTKRVCYDLPHHESHRPAFSGRAVCAGDRPRPATRAGNKGGVGASPENFEAHRRAEISQARFCDHRFWRGGRRQD